MPQHTGATTSSCRENAIPSEKWELMKNPIRAVGVNVLTTENTSVEVPLVENHKYICDQNFNPLRKEQIKQLETNHWLFKILENNFSEEPLKLWKNSPRYCTIKLENPNKIIRVKPMIYTKQDIDEFDIQIKELLDKGLIEETTSPHSSPAFMVRNHAEIKRGKARMAINYKRLNQNTIFDGYFIPRKEVLINQAKQAKYFSKFDCKSGFWQIMLTEESRPLTAFSAPNGHYQWRVMPFGLCNAPQVFQRWMDSIFKKYKKFCVVYIDDILIFSETLENHRKHLNIIAREFIKHGIILSPKKIELEKIEIEFLGLILSSDGPMDRGKQPLKENDGWRTVHKKPNKGKSPMSPKQGFIAAPSQVQFYPNQGYYVPYPMVNQPFGTQSPTPDYRQNITIL
ncbi:RNA-directed DNA polymerase-like protein [Gossypium australe]|uniref:RNA-directed DNA polymerase-like protein n=1 Tax=Gossypium australe TaxID=47621 RepID=A0A5B6WTV1_9ROSI|nr:RNA-directed DNA polymerase-like protein [Gossypium australe]